jgi:hypothetical protein
MDPVDPDSDSDPQHCLLGYSTSLLRIPSPLHPPIEQKFQVFSTKISIIVTGQDLPTFIHVCYRLI